ncbi:diguanylate cyclase [Herbaspirillum sp. HC18]|nr:diguanylate cyclase [Herbaspirillum sp. HC18]
MKSVEKRQQRIPDLLRARDLLTVAVFLASLLVTYQLWHGASRVAIGAVRSAFDYRVSDVNGRIRERLQIYEQVLRATKGLFMASEHVSRTSFRAFVDTLDLSANYPGVQGIGYAVVIRPQDLARHIMQVRAEGFADYTVHPEGVRDLYTSILYIEPFYGKNLRAFGYDMFSEPIRRAAMEKARDTGETALTSKVTLVQESGGEVQSGCLMYLPVYRNDVSNETQEQRRERLLGWVYAPFRMDDFMHGLLEKVGGDIDIEIYDMGNLSDEARMFDSIKGEHALAIRHRLRAVNRIEVANHTWTVAIAGQPVFEQRLESGRPQLILQAGISISFLLALLMWIFLDDRARAVQAATQAMQLALYDSLTGLPNRKLLEERLHLALAIAKRHAMHAALLFIDLDKFKPVNDNFGHACGDLLLKEVARRLMGAMRESDTASRLGGDEFVVLLPEVEDEHDVAVVAHKILETLNRPYAIAGNAIDVSASIGAAIYPQDGRDGKALMRSADLAMYEAKNTGRANVMFARGGAGEG